jgi:hypothetical protein
MPRYTAELAVRSTGWETGAGFWGLKLLWDSVVTMGVGLRDRYLAIECL